MKTRDEALKKAGLLSEALPYMQRYDGRCIVIKYGGSAMTEGLRADSFAGDVALLRQSGVRPVIVHGGGPQIDRFLKERGIESRFHNGLRITGDEEIAAAEMVLAGAVNKAIVRQIAAVGGRALGLSGMDAGLIEAEPLDKSRETLGFVGRPRQVRADILHLLLEKGIVPVIAPIAADKKGQRRNINADVAASAIAAALKAARLLILTNVPAVRGEDGLPLPSLSLEKALALIKKGVIQEGMTPKVETCLEAVKKGVEAAVILDGRQPHALLLELFTDQGAGTLFHARRPPHQKMRTNP